MGPLRLERTRHGARCIDRQHPHRAAARLRQCRREQRARRYRHRRSAVRSVAPAASPRREVHGPVLQSRSAVSDRLRRRQAIDPRATVAHRRRFGTGKQSRGRTHLRLPEDEGLKSEVMRRGSSGPQSAGRITPTAMPSMANGSRRRSTMIGSKSGSRRSIRACAFQLQRFTVTSSRRRATTICPDCACERLCTRASRLLRTPAPRMLDAVHLDRSACGLMRSDRLLRANTLPPAVGCLSATSPINGSGRPPAPRPSVARCRPSDGRHVKNGTAMSSISPPAPARAARRRRANGNRRRARSRRVSAERRSR